jgi:cell fate (sporulation/competence/biofilm development) regulator YlbF (YheA/YmcA/DUF963 family)
MELPEEIKNAAQALGSSLRQDNMVRAYLEAVEEFMADPEARQLEEQLYTIYNALVARQASGEQLSREDTQPFYELRRQVQTHPLISKRENELRLIRPYLADLADEISVFLGTDYTALARSE